MNYIYYFSLVEDMLEKLGEVIRCQTSCGIDKENLIVKFPLSKVKSSESFFLAVATFRVFLPRPTLKHCNRCCSSNFPPVAYGRFKITEDEDVSLSLWVRYHISCKTNLRSSLLPSSWSLSQILLSASSPKFSSVVAVIFPPPPRTFLLSTQVFGFVCTRVVFSRTESVSRDEERRKGAKMAQVRSISWERNVGLTRQ